MGTIFLIIYKTTMGDETNVASFEPVGGRDTSHLAAQDLSELKIEELTPLTPAVMSRQATINIGTIGHVAHGKSTVVKAISGVQTVRFRNELERNITIKLGYANAKIYKCTKPDCARPSNYTSYGSAQVDNPPCAMEDCDGEMELLRHVSFVDCPGHDILMATMLGVQTEGNQKASRVQKLVKGEVLMLNIGSTSTGGRILAVKSDLAKIVLTSPVCTQEGDKIALSRRVDKHWRLIGWGQIRRGSTISNKSAQGGESDE